jgi:hypothetical protein
MINKPVIAGLTRNPFLIVNYCMIKRRKND